jgi:hypothetical protein
MRRVSSWMVGSLALVLAAGCTTADGHRWTWPWEKPVAKEEINIPSVADSRYSEPQTLPKSAMKSGLPTKPADAGKPGMAGPGGMGSMGGMGMGQSSGRAGGYGGY